MSASYCWRPELPPPPIEGGVDIALADMITERFLGAFGSREQLNGLTFNKDSIGWLQGVADASRDDSIVRNAEEMIGGICQYGSIVLVIER